MGSQDKQRDPTPSALDLIQRLGNYLNRRAIELGALSDRGEFTEENTNARLDELRAVMELLRSEADDEVRRLLEE
ncbi:hypothetical protein [Streptomyces sp. V4I2]|uniref:hypothetical protein n=1 Tax=Streptomyces sp. V4I2 TaxID=3042280 RepID=UPI0027818890|nr:hypothetical protein [Streptomyces sp. V4I2]MDQ1049128.1 hypothetical protein [Streptomyces sp. V4I2]